MFYGGEINVPGAPGNIGTVPNTGGMPNRPVDPKLLRRLQQPGTPPPPDFREQYGLPPAPGNQTPLAGNPFGSDFVIPQQRQQTPGAGPQLNPLQQTPAMVFPKDQPGREGAIDVRFRQAFNVPGAPGNLAAVTNSEFYGGPQLGQMPTTANFALFASSPQGPHTPLPSPGWNPGMIKPPGDPNFRPRPMMEKTGPTGAPIPWQAAGFQNKFVS